MAVKLECRGKVGATQECAACGKKIHDRFLLKVRPSTYTGYRIQDTGYTIDSSSRSGLLQIQDTGYRIHNRLLLKFRTSPDTGSRFLIKVRFKKIQDTKYITDSSSRSWLPDIDTRYMTDFSSRSALTYKIQDKGQIPPQG